MRKRREGKSDRGIARREEKENIRMRMRMRWTKEKRISEIEGK
jgi:hypothetical protein